MDHSQSIIPPPGWVTLNEARPKPLGLEPRGIVPRSIGAKGTGADRDLDEAVHARANGRKRRCCRGLRLAAPWHWPCALVVEQLGRPHAPRQTLRRPAVPRPRQP